MASNIRNHSAESLLYFPTDDQVNDYQLSIKSAVILKLYYFRLSQVCKSFKSLIAANQFRLMQRLHFHETLATIPEAVVQQLIQVFQEANRSPTSISLSSIEAGSTDAVIIVLSVNLFQITVVYFRAFAGYCGT